MITLGKIANTLEANRKSHLWVFLAVLVLLSVFMLAVYGAVYNHPGYDYYFHLKRFEALITALQEGSFPIYIDYNAALDYGYLSKVFYSDIILIPFAILGVFIGASSAYEVMLFTMTILCGLFMYAMVKAIYKGSFIASLAALLYTFSVYRLFDIYNRGALGELFAFTFIPLVFLGLYHIIKGDYKKWYIIAISFSLLIFSHVISTVLTFLTALIFLLIYYKSFLKEPKRFYYLVLAGFVTIAITSTYIFPLFEQLQSNTFRFENDDWTLPSRSKLPLNYWLWGLLCGFVYPKDIVIVGIGILLTSVILLRLFIREKSPKLRSVDIGVLIGIIYIIACSSIFPWGRFPFTLLSFIQYPTRLYLLVTFFFSIAGGYYLAMIFKGKKSRFIISSVVILLIGITLCVHNDHYKYMHTTYINETNEQPTPTNFFYLNGAEYVPEKASSGYFILERGESIRSIYNQGEVTSYHRDKNVFDIQVVVNASDSLELPLYYYKGYTALLNNNEQLPVSQSKCGLVQIPVNESGNIKVYYEGTIIQKVSWYTTIISILALCFYIFVQNRKKKRLNNIPQ